MKYIKPFILVTAILILSIIANAQKIENIEAVFNNDRVTVYYDLVAAVDGQKFDVKLYSSRSKSPLNYVSGDVGRGVQAGKRKYIEYLIVKDIPSFDGELTFEVRANLVFTPLSLLNFTRDTSVRRGTIPKLRWRGGSTTNTFKVELLQKDHTLEVIKNEPDRTANWKIPINTPIGSKFQLKVIDETTNSIALSKSITIKRKIPLVISIGIPLVVVAGGTIAVIALTGHHASSSNGNSNSNSTNSNAGLPGPPNPTQIQQ